MVSISKFGYLEKVISSLYCFVLTSLLFLYYVPDITSNLKRIGILLSFGKRKEKPSATWLTAGRPRSRPILAAKVTNRESNKQSNK